MIRQPTDLYAQYKPPDQIFRFYLDDDNDCVADGDVDVCGAPVDPKS